MGFKNVQCVNVSDVRWERVSEADGRVAEGSGAHGGHTGRRDGEAEGGR